MIFCFSGFRIMTSVPLISIAGVPASIFIGPSWPSRCMSDVVVSRNDVMLICTRCSPPQSPCPRYALASSGSFVVNPGIAVSVGLLVAL